MIGLVLSAGAGSLQADPSAVVEQARGVDRLHSVLVLEGGHSAEMAVNGDPLPYIPQWIVIFMLILIGQNGCFRNGINCAGAIDFNRDVGVLFEKLTA